MPSTEESEYGERNPHRLLLLIDAKYVLKSLQIWNGGAFEFRSRRSQGHFTDEQANLCGPTVSGPGYPKLFQPGDSKRESGKRVFVNRRGWPVWISLTVEKDSSLCSE